ncbi:MAG TPA: hypothetical protein DCS12_04235 [Clostridiales bacterium]|nr:hypothetical protein [Clostridiales bacterium]
MTKNYTREEIHNLLNKQIIAEKPIFIFGAGTGLTAKCAELGGADLIGIYSTAIYRMQGLSSLIAALPYGNANDELLYYAKNILRVVKKTPCIAGLGAQDPTRDIETFIDQLVYMGFSGISNEPFTSLYGKPFTNMLEQANIGFSKEAELISIANRKNIFSLAWAFNEEEAIIMTEAGADIIGVMAGGLTSGGITGAQKTISLEDAIEMVIKICNAVKKINKNAIVITHGGPFENPVTAECSIKNTGAAGYLSGSSGERIPTETSVIEIVKKYKNMKMK